MKRLLLALFAGVFLIGCGSDSTTAKVVEEEKPKVAEVQKEVKVTQIPKVQNIAKDAANIVYSTFQDVAKIGPEGKYMILVFGTNTCPYCMKLKEDIYKSDALQTRLKNDYSAYYFKTHENLRHKLYHEGEYMDVDTKTMISIYGVEGTPTLIFADKKGKAIIMVPGYMPTKQFLVTLDFMESKKWEGKDRKNGEVYQVLKEFYIDKGVIKQ